MADTYRDIELEHKRMLQILYSLAWAFEGGNTLRQRNKALKAVRDFLRERQEGLE